jgi:hypothetical protein
MAPNPPNRGEDIKIKGENFKGVTEATQPDAEPKASSLPGRHKERQAAESTADNTKQS